MPRDQPSEGAGDDSSHLWIECEAGRVASDANSASYCMRHCYSAHGPDTLVMEGAKSLKQIFSKRPTFASVEKNAKH